MHRHEWIPWEDEPWFFTCKDENCPRVLDKLEVTERVNAVEKLPEGHARTAASLIKGHSVKDNLKEYAKALKGD